MHACIHACMHAAIYVSTFLSIYTSTCPHTWLPVTGIFVHLIYPNITDLTMEPGPKLFTGIQRCALPAIQRNAPPAVARDPRPLESPRDACGQASCRNSGRPSGFCRAFGTDFAAHHPYRESSHLSRFEAAFAGLHACLASSPLINLATVAGEAVSDHVEKHRTHSKRLLLLGLQSYKFENPRDPPVPSPQAEIRRGRVKISCFTCTPQLSVKPHPPQAKPKPSLNQGSGKCAAKHCT